MILLPCYKVEGRVMDDIVVSRGYNHKIITVPIMLFVLFFIVWSYFSEVDEIVRGEGKVIPSSMTKVVQHLEGGIIEEIYLKEGDRVKAGDPIYKLKNALSQSDLKEKEISIEALEYKKERLKAQIEFKNGLNFDDQDSLGAKNEISIFNSQMKNFFEQRSILQDQLDQNRLHKQQLDSKLANLQAELKIARENLSILDKLLKEGAASKKQYLAELAKKQSIVTKLSDIKSSIPIAKQKIKESLTKIKSFKSEKKTVWLKELTEVDIEIKKLKQRSLANDDREERKVVLSPVDGIINRLYFHTIGGIIKPGDKLAEITPVEDSLIIEGRIKTVDRGDIYTSQEVSIEITAYNYAKYGLLKGRLISISPDSFLSQDGRSSYYKVKVKSDKNSFDDGKLILPGMMANINILTGKKSVMEYIVKPLKDIGTLALSEK